MLTAKLCAVLSAVEGLRIAMPDLTQGVHPILSRS